MSTGGPLDSDRRERVEHDAELAELAVHAGLDLDLLSEGDWAIRIRVRDGAVTLIEPDGAPAAVAVRLPEAAWRDLTDGVPSVGKQSVLAYLRPGAGGELTGDELLFAQHLGIVRRVVELLRPPVVEEPVALLDRSGIRGRYVRCRISGLGDCDVYIESAGRGTPVVLLPTAGSETSQFHPLLADPELTTRFELFAFDLPWHGKSAPAAGARNTAYRLDSERYVDSIATVITALGLDRPIVYGASMAGAAVVELAARRPDVTSGVVGAQAGPRVANRRTPWLRHPRVNQTTHVAEWTYGLMSPHSPKAYRDRVWWSYSQGGFGVYDADIGYYSTSWDIDNVRGKLDGSVPVILMSGAWDYSVPTAATRELADLVPGAELHEMPELGHFPHAENPPVFRKHLLWALDRIGERRRTTERTPE